MTGYRSLITLTGHWHILAGIIATMPSSVAQIISTQDDSYQTLATLVMIWLAIVVDGDIELLSTVECLVDRDEGVGQRSQSSLCNRK